MTDQRPVKRQPSLLERAADMFGLDPAANAPTIDVSSLPPEEPKKVRRKAAASKDTATAPEADIPAPAAPAPTVEADPAPAVPAPRTGVAKAAPAIRASRSRSMRP